MKYWYTSDSHLGHRKIIEYCDRPFSSVEEMNRVLIERWNEVVKPEDIVYHCGDFAFGPVSACREFLDALNGTVFLVLGNHDRSARRMEEVGFAGAFDSLIVEEDGMLIGMNHRPKFDIGGKSCDIYLYGHVHNIVCENAPPNSVNICVEHTDYRPVDLEWIRSRVK
jgi:calcineurin-like phosphoesterase family protein